MTKRLDFRAQIAEAVKTLNLSSDDFKLINPYEHENILVAILDRFTTLGKEGLNYASWSNFFQEPYCSIHPEYAPAVLRTIASTEEMVWFIAEDWTKTKQHGNFWLYEGRIVAIADILGEMHCFEYYIVSKKFEWLLCEEHHGILIGVGRPMVESIKSLRDD